MEEKREKIERELKILFLKFTNKPKAFSKDVTSYLYRAKITLLFYASEDFRCNKIEFIH